MPEKPHALETLSDRDLLSTLATLAADERQATARFITALAEADTRRLYLGEGCSSMFTYCMHVLHLSEYAAYARIEAARAARQWPVIVDLIAEGSLHLTAITLLRRHLTTENHQTLLAAARHKSKREIEQIIAALQPQPAAQTSVRKLPAAKEPLPKASVPETRLTLDANLLAVMPKRTLDVPAVPAPPRFAADIKPLAPELYKLQVTVSRETYDTLRQVQDLMRHRLSDGNIATILDRALTLLLAELQKTKHAVVTKPRTRRREAHGRHVPAAVKRAVWARDGGQCAFVGTTGRCSQRGFLEYHHVVPYADGGATVVANLELRCRAHNAYEADRWFGSTDPDIARETATPYRVDPCEAAGDALRASRTSARLRSGPSWCGSHRATERSARRRCAAMPFAPVSAIT